MLAGETANEAQMKAFPAVNAQLISAVLSIFSGMLFWVTGLSQTPSGTTPARSGIQTVVDMSEAELLEAYHRELSNLDFSLGRNSEGEELERLLEKVGKNVKTFFQDFSNTASREQVHMRACNPAVNNCIDRTEEFNYLILPHTEKNGASWEEARTDKNQSPVNQKAIEGFCISSGYAFLSMYLHPGHQVNSRFRYLGRENKEPRSHIIAFAQRPEAADYLSSYFFDNLVPTTGLLVQGFAWLDPESYQLTRMRTTLLLCEKDNIVKNQTTDIHYMRVAFEDGGRQFWLPREVKVSWELANTNIRFMNQHKYSDYHLFAVESDYKITPHVPK
jgi:hypothetical protein